MTAIKSNNPNHIDTSSLASQIINYLEKENIEIENIDENGNVNCEECVGCQHCINCRECTNCVECIDCEKCRSCNFCTDCEGCRYCSTSRDCWYADHCHNGYFMAQPQKNRL